jgi:Uri superfamily endonuclease
MGRCPAVGVTDGSAWVSNELQCVQLTLVLGESEYHFVGSCMSVLISRVVRIEGKGKFQ